MKDPLVTVLLPAYNAELYLAEAVESILKQTFSDFELLVINDGSKDRSSEIVRSFKDERIRLVENETNLRLIATLNKGIKLAKGKYIARMDADDVSLPDRLQKQVAFMEAHPEAGVCGTWFEQLGNPGKVVKYPESDAAIRVMMLYQTPFCHPSVILRKEVLEKNQVFFSPDFIHGEDYEMWIRLSSYTRFANIPEVLLHYRVHESSVSVSNQSVQQEKTYNVIRLAFQKAGMSISNEEITVFRQVMYAEFRADKKFIAQAERTLSELIKANEQSKYLPEHELKRVVAEKWFHLCYNTTQLGAWVRRRYRDSKLPKPEHTGFMTRVKFFMKSVQKAS